MLKHLITASRQGCDEIRSRYHLNFLVLGAGLVLAVIVWAILSNWFFADFDPRKFWLVSKGDFWHNLWLVSAPIALFAFVMGQLDWFSNDEDEDETIVSENIFFKSLVSIQAGLVEELSHRGWYIYYGLLSVTASNMILGWILPDVWNNPVHRFNNFILSAYESLIAQPQLTLYVFGGLMLLARLIVALVLRSKGKHYSFASVLVGACVFAVWADHALPKGIVTLRHLPIIPAGADQWTALLYIGAVMWSNAKFREGHTYQGPVGILNSHVFAIFVVYVTFRFGLAYAIIVHFIHNATLYASEHVVQVIKDWQCRGGNYRFHRIR